MNFTKIASKLSHNQADQLAKLLLEFLEVQDQLTGFSTMTRSWDHEDLLAKAREMSDKLRGEPWNLDSDLLWEMSEGSTGWRAAIADWQITTGKEDVA